MTTTPPARVPSEYVSCIAEATGFRIELGGEIDLLCRPQLQAVLDQVLAAAPAPVVVDLTDVSFFGSEGLSFIAGLRTHLGDTEHKLILHGPNRSARRSLEITGFDKVVTIVAGDNPDSAPHPPTVRTERSNRPT
jgi:anti-anti-sigma factor